MLRSKNASVLNFLSISISRAKRFRNIVLKSVQNDRSVVTAQGRETRWPRIFHQDPPATILYVIHA